jgi:hypothetical protein
MCAASSNQCCPPARTTTQPTHLVELLAGLPSPHIPLSRLAGQCHRLPRQLALLSRHLLLQRRSLG